MTTARFQAVPNPNPRYSSHMGDWQLSCDVMTSGSFPIRWLFFDMRSFKHNHLMRKRLTTIISHDSFNFPNTCSIDNFSSRRLRTHYRIAKYKAARIYTAHLVQCNALFNFTSFYVWRRMRRKRAYEYVSTGTPLTSTRIYTNYLEHNLLDFDILLKAVRPAFESVERYPQHVNQTTHKWTNEPICICVYVCICVYIYIYIYIYVFTYLSIYIYIYIDLSIYLSISIYIYI